MSSWTSQCETCKHYLGDQPRPHCLAFPRGIRTEIIQNKVLHLSSIPGDKGIIWEPINHETPIPQQMSDKDLGL